MLRHAPLALVLLAGCGDPTPSVDAATPNDAFVTPGNDAFVAPSDGGPGNDAFVAIDAATIVDAATMDDAGPSTCGTAQPTLPSTGTEGLAIARDGTIYYSVAGGVARLATDGTVTGNWLRITGATTIWGLALDADNTHLFIGDPSTGHLRVATSLTTTPTQTTLATIPQPNGVTVGPDGAVYVSDFANDTVLRVDAASGTTTTVTASDISGADGVAFTDDGHLLVTSYGDGTVVSLTLDGAHHETARATVATSVPSADGVAIDEHGILYVGGGQRVYRIGATGTPDMTLQMGHSGTANLEWGAGALNCHDLYVATGTGLTRIPLTVGERDVLWH